MREVLLKSNDIKQASKVYGGCNFDSRGRTSKENIVLIRVERYLAQYIDRKQKK